MALSDATVQAEDAVLGSMLIDSAAVPKLLSLVRAEDFTVEDNRRIFEAVRALFRQGAPVDPLTVADKLGWSQVRDKRAYLASLIEITPSSANCAEYAVIMREQAVLRKIHGSAMALAASTSLEDCRDPFAGLTEAFSGAGDRIEAWTMPQMLEDFGTRQAGEQKRQYIPIGIREIDENTYLELGDLMVIGGSPSDGKTALALCVAYHMSRTYNVGFYSLETRKEKLEDRLMASGFGISFDAIKRGQMTEADWNAFAEQSSDAVQRRLTVLCAPGLTAEQITSSARARGFEIIVIDYGQLITPANTRNTTRAEQMAEVSRTLHTFAQATKTLVILLLQLNRKERASNRERDMFDLGESSQFEKDADLILLLYRPTKDTRFVEGDKDSEPLDPDTTRILRIAKQKEGKRVRLPLAFDGDHQSFAVLSPNPYREIQRVSKAIREKRREAEGQVQFTELDEGKEDMPF